MNIVFSKTYKGSTYKDVRRFCGSAVLNGQIMLINTSRLNGENIVFTYTEIIQGCKESMVGKELAKQF